MVGRGAKMSKALTQKARDSEFPDMDECIESSRGSETLDEERSKPLTFLLPRRSMLPEVPAGRFCGIGKLIARISSSRMWSCSLRLLLDLRRLRDVSLGGPLRNDWGRCSFPRSFAVRRLVREAAWKLKGRLLKSWVTGRRCGLCWRRRWRGRAVMSSALDARLGRCASLARPGSGGGSLKGFLSTSCRDVVERELVLLRRPLRWRGKASLPGPWTATACTRLLSAAAERPSFNLAALALLRPNGHGISRGCALAGLATTWATAAAATAVVACAAVRGVACAET